jgi:Zn finger protein HypA/HybF involved in hydrogenase expression
METVKIKCKKCGHKWSARYIEHKAYYLCANCRYYNRAEEVLQNGKQ